MTTTIKGLSRREILDTREPPTIEASRATNNDQGTTASARFVIYTGDYAPAERRDRARRRLDGRSTPGARTVIGGGAKP